jgi:hypothetical protein
MRLFINVAKNRTKKKKLSPRRLLLVSCSQRKRRTRALLPAINRYDGPAFRVLRRYLVGQSTAQLKVLILSAKWGLISGDTPLPYYDQQMTGRRARELRPLITKQLRKILKARSYEEMFIAMSESYFQVLTDQELSKIANLTIYIPQGRQGQKISSLYDWLHGSPPPARKIPNESLKNKHKKTCLRGIEISYTKEKALKLARQALLQNLKTATRTYSWYVQLGEKRISPKWLVSLLTDLPVSAFVTDEARRVLAQLGIEVHRASNLNSKS